MPSQGGPATMVRSDRNSGLLILKLGCICFCLFSLLSLMPGFRSARSSNYLGDFVPLLNAIIFAFGFYGIHRRVRSTWRFGWLIGSIFLFEWLVLCFAPILRHPKPNAWIASVVLAIGGFAVALY